MNAPNLHLRDARKRTPGVGETGAHMSRRALATAVNEWIYENCGGRVVDLDSNYIGKLERGAIRWPQHDYRRALRAVLGAPTDASLGFRAPSREPDAYVSPTASASNETSPAEWSDVLRRDFLKGAVGSGIGGARWVRDVEWTPASDSVRNVDAGLAVYFDQQLAGHYRADMMLGPRDLIEAVAAQYTLIDRIARAADEVTRKVLLKSATGYAALIGWLHQDAGDLTAATFWRGVASEVAQRTEDHDLHAYTLLNHASVKTDLGDGPAVLDLCDNVMTRAPSLSPKLRLLALQQRAHGASLVGDRRSVDISLDSAAPLVDVGPDGTAWGNACHRTPAYVEVQRATCYGRLGLAPEAAALWDQVLAVVPASARRDRGMYLARQATALAHVGEPDRAIASGRAAASLARETGSVRIARELDALTRANATLRSSVLRSGVREIAESSEEA